MISRSSDVPQKRLLSPRLLFKAASWTLALIALAVNGALSHFRPGQSTWAQRVWIMAWLAFGVVLANANNAGVPPLILYSMPAIGGFVIVSQMIMYYGNCVKLG